MGMGMVILHWCIRVLGFICFVPQKAYPAHGIGDLVSFCSMSLLPLFILASLLFLYRLIRAMRHM
ncbi:hypothetical protein B0T24DRAFT_617672 [Lasiosphaeria ovina]|uniref:Uncharacterized protein n=1 Tax=Lasiosphaeria ovina TaxID=92902 RepID=A0AAE0KHN7_9PEZI|nr:hypothetical protein B0T24DRAFT_617672 [Lasiosphaeria ovina]